MAFPPNGVAATVPDIGLYVGGRAREPPEWRRVVIAGHDGMQDSVNHAGQEMTRRKLNI